MPKTKRPSRASRATSRTAPRLESLDPSHALLRSPEIARPWPSLVFLAPFLFLYMAGLLWIRPDLATQTDLWIRQVLAPLGLTGAMVPTLVVVTVLLVWHLARHDPWQFPPRLLVLMAAETGLLVLPLLGLEGLFQALAHAPAPSLAIPYHGRAGGYWTEAAVTSVGAAIYEELLFRLLLIGLLVLLARQLPGFKDQGAVVVAALVAAALFAGAHNIDRAGSFTWPLFLFRTAAGVYLSAVFLFRGFGVAAGVHCAYALIIKLATAGA